MIFWKVVSRTFIRKRSRKQDQKEKQEKQNELRQCGVYNLGFFVISRKPIQENHPDPVSISLPNQLRFRRCLSEASKSDFIAVCQSNGVREEACEALYQQMMGQFGATVVAYHVHLGFDRFDDAEALKSIIDEDTIKASRDLMDRATW